jgi:hypothetical protein
LKEIYKGIAGKTVNASYEAQTIKVTGISADNILYPDSYIKLYYSQEPVLGYGEISLTLESETFDNNYTMGSFTIPNGTRPLDAIITSYSAEYWTDQLNVSSSNTMGWEKAYLLGDYGDNYTLLGDSYTVHIPVNLIGEGINNITISTGISPVESMGGSPDDKAIYTVAMKAVVSYGEPKPEREGCNWLVEFHDGSTNLLTIPSEYTGIENCNYTSTSIAYNNRSSISDAAYRLFKQMDVYPTDGRLDVKFDPDHVKADASPVGGIRSLWGPVEVKLVVWMK